MDEKEITAETTIEECTCEGCCGTAEWKRITGGD